MTLLWNLVQKQLSQISCAVLTDFSHMMKMRLDGFFQIAPYV